MTNPLWIRIPLFIGTKDADTVAGVVELYTEVWRQRVRKQEANTDCIVTGVPRCDILARYCVLSFYLSLLVDPSAMLALPLKLAPSASPWVSSHTDNS